MSAKHHTTKHRSSVKAAPHPRAGTHRSTATPHPRVGTHRTAAAPHLPHIHASKRGDSHQHTGKTKAGKSFNRGGKAI